MIGRVIKGMDVIVQASEVETGAQNKPLTPIKIVDCGVSEEEPENLEHEHLKSQTEDVAEKDIVVL